ncbi:aldehyde dehydrogenase [Castellaniella sp.]|uniref:aldehyde dehydrogenase n=1 Tax=Castellaniella sp. TaxID=1955812 RepID=UPI003C764CBC
MHPLTFAQWKERAAQAKIRTRHYIDGEFRDAIGGGVFSVVNPADGSVLAKVGKGGADDIDVAVASARKTFKDGVWSRMDPRDRMDVLYRLAGLIERDAEEFALLDTLCMGKPISDMLAGDVPFSQLTFQFFAECIDKMTGHLTNTDANSLHYISREPLGVVGCIVPWNYPLMMAAWKVAPALAAGNSVVLKPAEQSPLSALLLAELFVEAGGPPGVFNVVNGLGEEAGKALALHRDVDKISFTGSVEVGKLMLIYAGQSNMKRVSTECGGKSPQIILADAVDLDVAAEYVVNGIFANQGEVCSAGSRILVQSSIHDDFLARVLDKASNAFAPGHPLDPATTMGPLVTREQRERVLGYVAHGREEGATLAYEGSLGSAVEGGFYVAPTLFTEVRPAMRIAREEIFGPVAAVMSFETPDEAIRIANDSIYGLAASVWTGSLSRAHRMARDIEAGMIWVNCYDHGDMTQPWGGYKQSGNGRDKCFEALLAHTQTKSVWVHLG